MKLNEPLPNGTFYEQLRPEQLRDKLKAYCLIKSQKEVARELGVSASYLSDILRGNREFPETIAVLMGYQKTVLFYKSSIGNP
jgi:transcriptional regulator with XRE-family HTH domain